jgi:hypothetical protein
MSARAKACVWLHLPPRFEAMLHKGDMSSLYAVIHDLVTARGGTVRVTTPNFPKDQAGRPMEDGDLHVVNIGTALGPGYLNAATAYLADYWHLDPQGVQAASSIGGKIFDPNLVDPVLAARHMADLRARFVLPRRSRYRQAMRRVELEPGGIAVFLQGPAPYRLGQAYLKAEPMIRAVCAGSGGRAVWIKPHPLKEDEGLALIAHLQAGGLPIQPVVANVHDILSAACVTVSVNSAVAVEGMLHATPAILFGRSDLHPMVETVTRADDFEPAIERALDAPRDYAAFLYWYFHDQCLWLGAPDLAARILGVFAAQGFDSDRLGLTA